MILTNIFDIGTLKIIFSISFTDKAFIRLLINLLKANGIGIHCSGPGYMTVYNKIYLNVFVHWIQIYHNPPANFRC